MSSRNALLSEDERERATLLSEALETARDCILAGGSVEASLDIGMALLEAGDFKIDYLAYVDGDTLEPLDGFRPDGRLIAAASLGKVRLIDNVRVLSATG
jgi:pantoate--beta-alanine ligase